MARPTKQGIDYFPIDCNFDDKTEMYLIEKGAVGLSVLVTLWQMIYSNNGYYIENGKDLSLLIKRRINVDINEINECINSCLDRNIFDKSLHKKYNILTSSGIQKRYLDAAKRKKEFKIYKEFALFDVNVYNNLDNVNINSINVNRNATNVNVNVKEEVNIKYADYVNLKKSEYQKLIDKYGEDFTKACIVRLNNYKGANGKKYKSDYLAILNWVIDREKQTGEWEDGNEEEDRFNETAASSRRM